MYKILRVITSMNPENGGPCQGIRNSIPTLRQLGVHNEVVCFDSPDAAFLGSDNFIIHAIGPSVGPYAYCPNLKTWLNDNLARFDAVIVHGLWQYNGYGTYLAWRKFKSTNTAFPKLFIMPHGMLDPYFQKAPGRKIKAIRNWIFWKLFESTTINNATGVLFTCEEELRLAKQTFVPYNPYNEINVGYGVSAPPEESVDTDEAFFSKFPELNKGKYLLFLSRVHEKKGVDLLIKSYIKIAFTNKDIVPLVIAGPGMDTTYGKKLKELVEEAKLNNKIFFTGMLKGNAKWGAIYGCEAFVLPSHQENFGIAVAEALACARPVLISNQVNIWKEIAAGNGGIIEKDTQEGVDALLQKWLQMAEHQKINMGINAKKVYIDNFAIINAAQQLINSIKKV